MRFASFLSGGFITAIVVNPPERKLAKRTSVHCALPPPDSRGIEPAFQRPKQRDARKSVIMAR